MSHEHDSANRASPSQVNDSVVAGGRSENNGSPLVAIMMNKYNIRAIRNELDGYIRHASWKSFRSRLHGLDLELQRAVIEYRPTPNGKGSKKRHAPTLLHSLCSCVHAKPPVPVDLLESVLEACPHLLSSHRSGKTPLSIALDRQAGPTILECLLMHDITRQSLYFTDNKTGDTPILQAIKQEANDDVIQLLLRYDTSKQSLLIPSKKRNRVPLFYVANQELSFVHLEEGDDEVPGELEYMLLQTYTALKIRNGELSVRDTQFRTTPRATEEDLSAFCDEETHFDDEEDDLLSDGDSEEVYCMNLLQAVFACAHFLGDKHSISLISFLLAQIPDLSDALDESNNTMLHHLCHATHVFADSALLEGRFMTESILQRHRPSATMPNVEGNLPLHVALATKKPWDHVLRPLVTTAPETVLIGNTISGRLPLHIAISNYQSRSKEIYNLWRLHPEAAAIQDPLTRLFPFQLAAVDKDMSLQRHRNQTPWMENTQISSLDTVMSPQNETPVTAFHALHQKDIDQLSDIFFLLRASPQVLREFTT